MKSYYQILDKFGETVVTRSEISYLTTDSSMSEEEKEQAIQKYLDEHEATLVHKAEFDDYQKATRATAIYPKETALPYLAQIGRAHV